MFTPILLLALICQGKTPPPAPVARVIVVDNSKLIAEQNKKIADLQATVDKLVSSPCKFCGKKQIDTVVVDQPKKYSAIDKFGLEWENENYERLKHDIDLINRYGVERGVVPEISQQWYTAPQIQQDC